MKHSQVHVFPLTIDFDLLDAGKVVHHPNYLVLCERARSKALEDAGFPHREMFNQGMSFVLTETHSKYLKPAKLDDKLSILTKTVNFSRATLTLEQQLVALKPDYRNISGFLNQLPTDFIEQPYFWIELRLVCVKLNPIKAQGIPESLREKLGLKLS